LLRDIDFLKASKDSRQFFLNYQDLLKLAKLPFINKGMRTFRGLPNQKSGTLSLIGGRDDLELFGAVERDYWRCKIFSVAMMSAPYAGANV
jgi:hypothetical protein